jgi:signal transduction histidine kinase
MNKDFGEMNDEQKSYMEKAIESNERAVTLVNYLLTFNNAENIFTTLNFKEVDVLKLIDDVIAIFYGELKNKNIKLGLDKDGFDQVKIQGDKEMISVVIQNLIENAIKYSFENSEILVSIKKATEHDGIILSVHNSGICIKKEDQAKIFNKFFRAPNAIAKESIGSGLGLFTSRSIVEKHGGKIWFESEEDTGTTFFVFLPLS